MRRTKSEICFDAGLYTFLVLTGIVMLYPFLNMLAVSLNDPLDTVRGGIGIWPRIFTTANYKLLFDPTNSNLPHAFMISFLRTAIGVLLCVISPAMVAYVVSCREFVGRRFVQILFVVTMYVNGGLIPTYLLIRNLGLMNSFWVYILPGLASAFYIFVLRSYMDTLPAELTESARIDGANDLTIFWRIVFPVCMPVLAVVALFVAVDQWNAWYDTFLYCTKGDSLYTLQYELMRVFSRSNFFGVASRGSLTAMAHAPTPQSMRAAITIVATVPIVLVYPFVQRYFVKGMLLGAIRS